MLRSTLMIGLLLLAIGMSAQKRVILESGSTTTVFGGTSPFVDAYNAAVDGDVIYLPGGSFVPPAPIAKSLKIYGVGHHPDYTDATDKTYITSALTLVDGADGLQLEGLEVNGVIFFTDNNAIDNVTISRCKFYQLNINGNRTTPSNNTTIRESISISTIGLSNSVGATFTNCIFQSSLSNGSNAYISNNLFLLDGATTTEVFQNMDNSTVRNSIFLKGNSGIQENCDATTFENNVFTIAPTAGNSSFVNSYIVSDLSSFFVNRSGNVFDYTHDYTLSGDNATNYTGTDATQVGIYGGLFPFKTNLIPSNPHISAQSIATSTDESGNLSISITVEAQNE